MKLADFKIGGEFWCDGRQWRCSDIGTRTVVAIRIDRVEVGEQYARTSPDTRPYRSGSRRVVQGAALRCGRERVRRIRAGRLHAYSRVLRPGKSSAPSLPRSRRRRRGTCFSSGAKKFGTGIRRLTRFDSALPVRAGTERACDRAGGRHTHRAGGTWRTYALLAAMQ
jgi:hypothetical protein